MTVEQKTMPLQKEYERIASAKGQFLLFLKSKFSLYHLSNVFFRDIHYGVLFHLRERGIRARYKETEELAYDIIALYEQDGILKKVDERAYVLNYPAFALPKKTKTA